MSYAQAAIEFFGVDGEAASQLVAVLIACEMYAHEKQPSFGELVKYIIHSEGLKPRCAWEAVRYLIDTESPQLNYLQPPERRLPKWEPSTETWNSPGAEKRSAAQ